MQVKKLGLLVGALLLATSTINACPTAYCANKYVQTGTFVKCRHITECPSWSDEPDCAGGALNRTTDYQIKYMEPTQWSTTQSIAYADYQSCINAYNRQQSRGNGNSFTTAGCKLVGTEWVMYPDTAASNVQSVVRLVAKSMWTSL